MINYDQSNLDNAEPIGEQAADFIKRINSLSDFAYHARIGKALHSLIEQTNALVLHADFEQDLFRVSCWHEQERKHMVREADDLLATLLAAFSQASTKKCRGCKKIKPIDMFSRYKSKPDGRNYHCRECESERVKKYYHAKKRNTHFQFCSRCNRIVPNTSLDEKGKCEKCR